MAIYSASVSKVQRSKGQSATAAAAYQLRAEIDNPRTGEHHNYRRAGSIIGSGCTVPDGVEPMEPAELAVMCEEGESRKNSTTARRAIIALPHELDDAQRLELAEAISQAVTEEWGVGCLWAVHPPEAKNGSDDRNEHMHAMWTTRILGPEGLGLKTREWDDKKQGPEQVERFRTIVEERTNRALERAGYDVRVDRRSLQEQEAAGDAPTDTLPTHHEGPAVTAARRRGEILASAAANDEKKEHNSVVIELAIARAKRDELRGQVADAAAAQLEGLPTVTGTPSQQQVETFSAAVTGQSWPETYCAVIGSVGIAAVRYAAVGRDATGAPAPAAVIDLKGSGRIIDRGHSISTRSSTLAELGVLVALGSARGLDTSAAEKQLAGALAGSTSVANTMTVEGDGGAASRRAQDEALEQRRRQHEEQQEATQVNAAASAAKRQDAKDQLELDAAASRGQMIQIVGTTQATLTAPPLGGPSRDEMLEAYAEIRANDDVGSGGSFGSLKMSPSPAEGGGQVARDRAARHALKFGGKRSTTTNE
ncbi:MAG: MobA/MobL family protein [Candidatus Thiodiazotropha sp.]